MESIKSKKIKLLVDQDEAYDYDKAEYMLYKNKKEMLELILKESQEISMLNWNLNYQNLI